MDVYSKAIAFLTANPAKIPEIWDDPKSHWTGVLFQAVTPNGLGQTNEDDIYCGDLCEIRSNHAAGWTLELEEEIKKDIRIPKMYASNNDIPRIATETLEVFAEWQRKIDQVLNRDPNNFSTME
jgi:hypothetical protein